MSFWDNLCGVPPQEPQIMSSSISASGIKRELFTIKQGGNIAPKIMYQKSNYDKYLANCKKNNVYFEDTQFPANNQSLNFKVQGREIVWKRLIDIIPDAILFSKINPEDIQQGKVGDCYFLASISAIAEEQSRIQNIFFQCDQTNGYGIYKVIVNIGGCPKQIVFDDFIPVYAQTNRPVFCKPNGNQIWVVLLQKVWAKIKGSYGDISEGCPHQVLNTFLVAPCQYIYFPQKVNQQNKQQIWNRLIKASLANFPVVAGSKLQNIIKGIKPRHTYTVLDCRNVKSKDRVEKIMLMRNPWGATQYEGQFSQKDKKFWDGVLDKTQRQIFVPSQSVDDGKFTIPFYVFLQNFESIDIAQIHNQFSYEYERMFMTSNIPLLYRLKVPEQIELNLTLQKQYEQIKNVVSEDIVYGYNRILIAHIRDEEAGLFQYFDSKLQTIFPDNTIFIQKLPKGQYMILIQANFPCSQGTFNGTLSFYHTTLKSPSSLSFEPVLNYSKTQITQFLQSAFKFHASHNSQKQKIGNKNIDWIKSQLLDEKGGYAYIFIHIDQKSSIKLQIKQDQELIRQSGFIMMKNSKSNSNILISQGQERILIFTYDFQNKQVERSFPPKGLEMKTIV